MLDTLLDFFAITSFRMYFHAIGRGFETRQDIFHLDGISQQVRYFSAMLSRKLAIYLLPKRKHAPDVCLLTSKMYCIYPLMK